MRALPDGGEQRHGHAGAAGHAAEIGADPAYALRSATKQFRTTPLRGLWHRAPYFHDGRALTLLDVVDHYDGFLGLGLTGQEKLDLVEFLKSL